MDDLVCMSSLGAGRVFNSNCALITRDGHTLLEWQYEGASDNGWT